VNKLKVKDSVVLKTSSECGLQQNKKIIVFPITSKSNITRRCRVTYKFNNPKLMYWKIDQSIRLKSDNPIKVRKIIESKINFDDNVSDIEFEYTGFDPKDFISSLFILFELIF
jgi:hypothetical protein